MLLPKGGMHMHEKNENWRFLQLRAAQLFEEDDVQGALRLMETINQEQIRRLEKAGECEQIENC